MARVNGSKLADETWLLDKEDVLGYAPTRNPEMLVIEQSQNNRLKFSDRQVLTSLKSIGKSGLSLSTSGNLSPPSTENPFVIMKNNPQVFINMLIITTCWISISFNKYLIAFYLKHIQGNIFVNAGISPLADICGHLLCIPVQK